MARKVRSRQGGEMMWRMARKVRSRQGGEMMWRMARKVRSRQVAVVRDGRGRTTGGAVGAVEQR